MYPDGAMEALEVMCVCVCVCLCVCVCARVYLCIYMQIYVSIYTCVCLCVCFCVCVIKPTKLPKVKNHAPFRTGGTTWKSQRRGAFAFSDSGPFNQIAAWHVPQVYVVCVLCVCMYVCVCVCVCLCV
jgi:hypothetical protein